MSPKPPAVFLRIPKNAGTSLHETLEDAGLVSEALEPGRVVVVGEAKGARLRDRSPTEWGRSIRFAVARNPWDRVVSGWLYLGGAGYRSLRDALRDLPGPESFHEWHHLARPQSEFLFDRQGRRLPNRLLRFERLADDWTRLGEELGWPALPLRHDKRADRERDYRTYYDAETRRLVATIFRRDIDLLGYTFDGPGAAPT